MTLKSQLVSLQVRVKASDGVFPGLELADILVKFAADVRRKTYSATLDSEGTFLDMKGGVVWKHGDDDGTSESPEKG
jgi:hypothetical protein